MSHHKIGVIGMPFQMWRILSQDNITTPSELKVGRIALNVISQQIDVQSFHAHCGYPVFTTRPSRIHNNLFELVSTCDCGEEISILDGLHKDTLRPIGKQGAFVPLDNHQT